MVNRENFLLVTIWLFLALAVGFGAFMGLALTGSDINFPPAGTAYAETTEALTSAMWQRLLRLRDTAVSAPRWAHQGITSQIAAFPKIGIPEFRPIVNVGALRSETVSFLIHVWKLLRVYLVLLALFVFVGLPISYLIGWLMEPSRKEIDRATHREKAYVGTVVRID